MIFYCINNTHLLLTEIHLLSKRTLIAINKLVCIFQVSQLESQQGYGEIRSNFHEMKLRIQETLPQPVFTLNALLGNNVMK